MNISDSQIEQTKDNHLDHTQYRTSLLVLAIIAFIENLFIFSIIISSRKLRKKVVFHYVMNLLVTQMLVSTIIMPMYCYAEDHFLFGYITAFLIFGYILNLCCITYERHLAICKPYIYPLKMSYSKSIKFIMTTWALSLVTQMLPVLWNKTRHAMLLQRIYLGLVLFLFMLLPLIYVIYTYTYIIKEVFKIKNKATRKGSYKVKKALVESAVTLNPMRTRTFSMASKISHNTQKEMQFAVVFCIAALSYSITWIPVIFINITVVFDCYEILPENISIVSIYLLELNALFDPIIYGVFIKDTRARMKEIWSILTCNQKPKNII